MEKKITLNDILRCQDTILEDYRFLIYEHDLFDNRAEVYRIRINSEFSHILN